MPRGFLLVSVPTLKSSSRPMLSITTVRPYGLSAVRDGRVRDWFSWELVEEPGKEPRRMVLRYAETL